MRDNVTSDYARCARFTGADAGGSATCEEQRPAKVPRALRAVTSVAAPLAFNCEERRPYQ